MAGPPVSDAPPAAVPTLWREVALQARTALPISTVYLLQFLAMLMSQAVAGHVSADALAAVALASFYMNVCANAPLVGLAFASDSLMPPAIGAGNFQRAGHIAQRGALALLAASALVLPLLLAAGPVFGVLHQQPAVVAIATSYVRWLCIGLPAMALFEVYKKLVNACGLFAAPLALAASALAVQGALAYYFVYGGGGAATGLTGGSGMDGAAVAFVVSLWWCALGGAAHLATHRAWRCRRAPRCCCGAGRADADDSSDGASSDGDDAAALAVPILPLAPSGARAAVPGAPATVAIAVMDAHDRLDAALAAPLTVGALLDRGGWAEYLSAGLPAVIMMVLEWGSFEAMAVIGGTIDAPTQGAHAALGTIEFILFAPLLGFSLGISLRAGAFMGARDARAALRATRATFVVVAVYAVLAVCTVGALHATIVPLFTSDGPTGDLIARWSPMLCGVFVFDALQGTTGGVLRGIGRPVVGALSSVVSYLCVGLPLSYVLAKVAGWGLPGLWAGVGASVAVASAIMGVTLLRTDWAATADAVADVAAAETAEGAREEALVAKRAGGAHGSGGYGSLPQP